MKSKVPFQVNYTQEMSNKFNKDHKESGNCSVQNPDFYGKWNLLEVGSEDYKNAFGKTNKK